MKPPLDEQIEDPAIERVRQDHHDRIREIQASPAMHLRAIAGVELADGDATPIAHGLGRRPLWIGISPPRDAVSTGRIEEIRDGANDPRKFVVLRATGWGATIAVDLVIL